MAPKTRGAAPDEFGRLFKRRGGNQSRWQLSGEDEVDFEDDNFFFVDPTDDTKRVRIDAGGVTAATVRVINAPDRDITLGGGLGTRATPILASANLTLTAASSGALVVIDGASQAIVLPALTATEIGVYYDFIVQTTTTAVSVAAGAGDILHGGVSIMSTSAGLENDAFSANGTSDLVFSMNGTTKGGIIGSRFRFEAWSATAWLVSGNLIGSGVIITPFA